jgi:hypothetical protein
MLHVESRREAADRLAIAATLKAEADYKTRCAQAPAAEAILGRNTVEHIVLWTDSHGRARHSHRIEVVS